MKIAVAQFSSGMDKAANLARIASLIERAADAGARVVVFPEAAMCDFGLATDDLRGLAEALDGRFVQSLSELAARFDMTVVAGMFESIPDDRLIYNSAVVVDPERGQVGVFRKRHLYDAFGEVESERFRPGSDDPLLVHIDGFVVAVVICYDLRFASFIERAGDSGADLLLVPAAWVAGPLKEAHLSVIARARALDNTMYVAVGGQTGVGYTGMSVIVDPLGVVVGGLGELDGVAVADVSRERIDAARARLPVVAQRRAAPGGESREPRVKTAPVR
ncbi:MAG: carbon-nitrogen hydrolase family protein [Candidatus Dormibacteraeota bacterium]|nr:carbon-nitrogen hydrolase family protein [Candidatus Dormibacteraeota bacterium]